MIRRWYILMALAIITPAVAAQAATRLFREQVFYPVDEQTFSFCSGEWVHVAGTIHGEAQCLLDTQGAFHCQFVSNTQDILGMGLSSGASYRDVGESTVAVNGDGAAPFTVTEDQIFHLIGTGTVPNMNLKFLLHLTVNANGTVTVLLTDFSLDCR